MTSKKKEKVYFERPVEGGLFSAECFLPLYDWQNIAGFTKKEINGFQRLFESTAHIIIQLAHEGGLEDTCCKA